MVSIDYYIGIDIGATLCKAVAINSTDNDIVAKAITMLLGDPEKAANTCLRALSKDLKVKVKKLLRHSVVTGHNSEKASIEEKESEIICIGTGAHAIDPEIEVIVDVGSFSMKAVKIDDEGKVKDYMLNNKCAAGSGILLELVSEGLEMKVEELSDMAFKAKKAIQISSQCSIFAESEVISYKNEGADIADLVAGVCNSVAGRVYPIVRRLNKESKKVAFSGGVAKNMKVVQNLEERLNLKMVDLKIDPQYLTAFGASIIAKKKGGF